MKRHVSALLLTMLAFAYPLVAADEYFTDAEIDQIREAQNIENRIPVFLEIAEARLIALGLVVVEDDEDDDGDGNVLTRGIIRVLAPEAADQLEQLEQEQADMDDDVGIFNRVDLLRGYYQALEEAMDNIDDAYERGGRGNVRQPLEELYAYTDRTFGILEAFEPDDRNEANALEDALEIAGLARDGAAEALETVPRTEQR